MLVFMDEAGDSGFKFDKNSSAWLVISLVKFDDNDEADAADTRIHLLRREMSLPKNYEFHFNSCNRKIKETFFKALFPYNFFYIGIIINKQKLWGEGFKHKESFYKYISSLIFQNARPYLKQAKVIIDGCGSRDFKQSLKTYLRKKSNMTANEIKKFVMQDSHKNNLLQLADMVAGAIYRNCNKNKGDHGIYIKYIEHKKLNIQILPR